MHFQTYAAVLTGLCTLATASPIVEAREPEAFAPLDKREARYGNYNPQHVPFSHPVPVAASGTPVPTVDLVPSAIPAPSAALIPIGVTVPISTPISTSAPILFNPIAVPTGPDNGTPQNLTLPVPSPLGDELCFSTGQGRKKRAIPDAGNTDGEEAPLKTTLIDYIEGVFASFDGDKCPSKDLVQPPTNDDDGHRKRSGLLTKRQPQTVADLIKLIISLYNNCTEEGYRKRSFRPLDLDAFKNRPFHHHSVE